MFLLRNPTAHAVIIRAALDKVFWARIRMN